MPYKVVPGLWKVGGRVYRKGDLAPDGPTDSWLRLGLIEQISSPWWEGMTKAEILDAAVTRNIELTPGTKRDLIAQLESEQP